MKKKDIPSVLLLALLVLAPFGTRYIWQAGELGGVPVEPGTVSLFLTQMLVILYVTASFFVPSDRRVFVDLRSEAVALLLSVLVLVSVAFSSDIPASLINAAWILFGIILMFSMGRHRPSDSLAFIAFAAGACLQAALGIFQFLTQGISASTLLGIAEHSGAQLGAFVIEVGDARWLRAYGTLPHPNIYGIVLVAAILLLTTKLSSWRRKARIPAGAAVVLCSAGLFFSFSRSAYLALLVGLILLFFDSWKRSAKAVRRGTVYTVLLVAAVFGVFGLIFSEPLVTRFRAESRLETHSLQQRSDSIDDALRLLAIQPLNGVGPGMMPAAVRDNIDADRIGWDYQFVHNVPLLVSVEIGALGAMAWAALILVLLRFSWKKSLIDRRVPLWGIVFVSLLVAGMFDHYLWSSWFGQLIFWLTAGFMMTGHDDQVAAALDSKPKQV